MDFDDRMQGRVTDMMPFDVSGPLEMRARLRSYLATLSFPPELYEAWVEAACEGASHAGQAFARLQERLANQLTQGAADMPDDGQCGALWRLSVWLHTDASVLTDLSLAPPLMRQSMASERTKS
ncbi:MAG TPA: hypothetical protein VMV40_00415 [Acidiferrobacter sp.]|nr:hypothetical protein [Acidiferrobacter sp.]